VLAAVAQLTSTPDVTQNLSVVSGLIREAGYLGAAIIFFPEVSDFIARPADVPRLSRPLGLPRGHNEFVDGIQAAAKAAGIFVNIGIHELPQTQTSSVLETDIPPNARCYNTNIVVSDEGNLLSSYRKMHLFDVDLAPAGPTVKESATTIPGTSISDPVQTPVGNLGLQTCFDIRFPRHSQDLVKAGAVSLTYPASFTEVTGAAHWEVLLRARAIENQCYVFGSAQIGEHYPVRRSYGHAMIVDPWGTVVAQCPQVATSSGSLCFAEIDLDYVTKVRREIPM